MKSRMPELPDSERRNTLKFEYRLSLLLPDENSQIDPSADVMLSKALNIRENRAYGASDT
jgi:hypothetical protein